MIRRTITAKDSVLDLRDATGTGYRIAWRRPARAGAVTFFENEEIVLHFRLRNLDPEHMHELMETPRRVASQVMNDAGEAASRRSLMGGFASMTSVGFSIGFDLSEPHSNDGVRCEARMICPGVNSNQVESLSFVMTSEDLLAATDSLKHLSALTSSKRSGQGALEVG